MNLEDFNFDLPSELIATRPSNPREASKMLVVNNDIKHSEFKHLPEYLNKNDVLVINNTKVLPTYLIGELNAGWAIAKALLQHERAFISSFSFNTKLKFFPIL